MERFISMTVAADGTGTGFMKLRYSQEEIIVSQSEKTGYGACGPTVLLVNFNKSIGMAFTPREKAS